MGPQLSTILALRNMSVQVLSALAGISTSVIYKVINAIERVSSQVKVAIARALNLGVGDIDWVLPDAEETKPIGPNTNQRRITLPERLCNVHWLYYPAHLEECPEC